MTFGVDLVNKEPRMLPNFPCDSQRHACTRHKANKQTGAPNVFDVSRCDSVQDTAHIIETLTWKWMVVKGSQIYAVAKHSLPLHFHSLRIADILGRSLTLRCTALFFSHFFFCFLLFVFSSFLLLLLLSFVVCQGLTCLPGRRNSELLRSKVEEGCVEYHRSVCLVSLSDTP